MRLVLLYIYYFYLNKFIYKILNDLVKNYFKYNNKYTNLLYKDIINEATNTKYKHIFSIKYSLESISF